MTSSLRSPQRAEPAIATAPAPRVPRRRGSREGSAAPSYVTLTLIALFNIGVFLWILLEALKPNNEFLSTQPWQFPSHWAWSNFSAAWRDANIRAYFGNSVVVSFGATILSLLTSVPAAYALSRLPKSRSASTTRQLFFLGLLMPPVVLIVPLYFELSSVRMLDSLFGLVIVYAGLSLPFSIWYLSSFFNSVPRELEEAAAIDGATPLRSFRLVFLPNALSGCFAVFVVNFLWAWNEFFYALTFLNTDSKFTIALGVFNLQVNAEYSANWVTLFAGMLISMLPILGLYALLSQQITRAMAQGAVKG